LGGGGGAPPKDDPRMPAQQSLEFVCKLSLSGVKGNQN
jgi:hypothetical protein